jgi:hypothetical protein
MRQKLRSRLSYANVMATIAVFIGLATGGAYAANTIRSTDIVDGEVKTPDLATSAVTNPKLGPSSVASGKVLNNSLTGADLAPSALTRGRSITGFCDPESFDFVDCGTVELNLTRPSRVLIIASAMWYSDGNPSTTTDGSCHLAVNSFRISPGASPGETQDVSDLDSQHSLTLTNMTSPASLAPGSHTFGLVCDERNGDIVFNPTYVSVVILGSA